MEHRKDAKGNALLAPGTGRVTRMRMPIARESTGQPTHIASNALFGAASEVQIDHDGVWYRLRRTAAGKLILTK